MITIKVRYLRTEYLVNPLGIDEPNPRFSYLLDSDEYCKMQTAYKIFVASDPELLREGSADLWDSGKVFSSHTNQIKYQGKALSFGEKCYYKCIVFDEKDARYESDVTLFTVGFLKKTVG